MAIPRNSGKRKKEKRLKRKQELEKIAARDIFIRKTLENSGHIYVTSIKEESDGLLVISYIYDRRTNLSLEMYYLREKLQKPLKLRAKIGSEEAIERLIREPRRKTRKVMETAFDCVHSTAQPSFLE